MAFEFHLNLPSPQTASEVWRESLDSLTRYDEELPSVSDLPNDDFALIIESCKWLERTDAQFHVGGFGDDDWGLDTRSDLSYFLEDLPDAVRDLRRNEEFQIGVMSQGVERQLVFIPAGSNVTIRCYKGFELMPNIEVADFRKLDGMLTKLACDFTVALEMMDSRFRDFELYRRWRDGNFG